VDHARPLDATAWRLLSLVLLSGVVLSFAACAPRDRPRNVLLITVDTLRADHLGAYGRVQARTPVLDALAAEGVRFEEVSSVAPVTMPAHASIMTGLLPPAHGVRDNGAYALPAAAQTLAERFRDAGYDTAAFVSAVVLGRRYGLDQGFDVYDDALWDQPDPATFMIRERPARQTLDRALDWLDRRLDTASDRPFFVWVHLFDPHQPYRAPEAFAAGAASPYDAEIAYADHELGRLLEELRQTGRLEDTLVVATADHGESLGEHEEQTHAIFVYRSTIRVPLILRHPASLGRGKVVAEPVSVIDIAPSILAATGLPSLPAAQGIDLLPLVRGGKGPADRVRYSESLVAQLGFGMAPLFAVRSATHTWIRAPRPELYDLRVDPGELRNLAGEAPPEASDLDVALQLVLDDSAGRALVAVENPMSRETMEMLQSLGYLQGERERAAVDGMDPKDGIRIYNLLEDARHAAQDEDWPRAEALARAILEQIPGHFSARGVLAMVHFRTRRLDEAEAEYRRMIADDPRQFRLYGMLALIDLYRGDLDAAERSLHAALAVSPGYVEAIGQLGMVAMLRGDPDAAQDWYRKALAIDPGFPSTYRRLGDLHYQRGEHAAALAQYREALARNPADLRSLVQAGNSARRTGDLAAARGYFERAIAVAPGDWIAAYNLACLDAVGGDHDAALRRIDQALQAGFTRVSLLQADPDLEALRRDERFAKRLLALQRSLESAGDPAATRPDGVRADD